MIFSEFVQDLHRLLRTSNVRATIFITSSAMTKIVSAFTVAVVFDSSSTEFLVVLFLNALFIIVFIVGIFVFRQRRESLFQQGFPEFLTAIILQMKMGKSFRSAYQSALPNLPEYQKEILAGIYQNVAFLPQNDDKKMTTKGSYNIFLLQELRKIDRSTHQTVEKISNFRGRLITMNNFRRRSGRVRENIYVQVGFMAIIYLVLTPVFTMRWKLGSHFLYHSIRTRRNRCGRLGN